MFNSRTTVEGVADVVSIKVIRNYEPGMPELSAYVALSFRANATGNIYSLAYEPKEPDIVQFLLDLMDRNQPLYMVLANLNSGLSLFDSLAYKWGFTGRKITTCDIVHMNAGIVGNRYNKPATV